MSWFGEDRHNHLVGFDWMIVESGPMQASTQT
jgi:hypothetical protein